MLLVLAYVLLVAVSPTRCAPECEATHSPFSEGNIGQSSHFPWLGVLRVHLHQGGQFKIALTGLVLVKEQYALANSDDVAKIPKKLLLEDSSAMFYVAGAACQCVVRDYTLHPEYEYSTLNSVALLELYDSEEESLLPSIKPVCWPAYAFNTSNELYVVGYVDDNKVLEKNINKVEYVTPTVCKEFYTIAGLGSDMVSPIHYHCAVMAQNSTNCVWDNGAALVTNSTGVWQLVGFGVRGPGCAAPAKFIDFIPLQSWVSTFTDNIEEIDDYDYRKSALNTGFRPKTTKDVPLDALSRVPSPPPAPPVPPTLPAPWPTRTDDFTTETQETKYFTLQGGKMPLRKPYDLDECNNVTMHLVHEEDIRIAGRERPSRLFHSISVHDLNSFNYTCILITVNSPMNGSTNLSHRTKVVPGSLPQDGTQDSLLKNFLLKIPSKNEGHSTMQTISTEKTLKDEVPNIKIDLQLKYIDETTINIKIFDSFQIPLTKLPRFYAKTVIGQNIMSLRKKVEGSADMGGDGGHKVTPGGFRVAPIGPRNYSTGPKVTPTERTLDSLEVIPLTAMAQIRGNASIKQVDDSIFYTCIVLYVVLKCC